MSPTFRSNGINSNGRDRFPLPGADSPVFNDPRFAQMGEMLAMTRGVTVEQLYAGYIQAEIGSYIENGDLGAWGQKVYDELSKAGYI